MDAVRSEVLPVCAIHLGHGAAARGHEVILCEKSGRLGGVLRCEEGVSFKKHLGDFLDNQEREIARAGIDVRLNTAVTPEFAVATAPDVIIAALGAKPVIPDIPGIAHAVGAEDVYYDPSKAGQRVVILGGGLVGSELAIHLARLGREVTIVELADSLSNGGNMLQGLAIGLELARLGVDINLSATVQGVTSGGVDAISADGSKRTFEADTVIYAVGQRALSDEAEALRFCAPEFHRIGDCLLPGNIVEATRAAYNISRDVGRFV